MDCVVTLIAAKPGRLTDLAIAAAGSLPDCGGPVWLAPDEACDLFPAHIEATAAAKAVRALIGEAPVDIVAQPLAGRRKHLLVADMESTIIENEMLDELADYLGLRTEVAEITRRAMNDEIDFVAALNERVALLAGMPEATLEDAARHIRIMPGAAALVATMKAAGATTALVSGGFTVFAERVAAALGFDRVVANRLEIADGRIVGAVCPPIVTRDTKRETLLALAAERGVTPSAALAVGDGANDLAMLAAAGLGIAFRAKPAVAAAARQRIDHADLTALLYAQGYRHSEILMLPRGETASSEQARND